MSYCLQCNTDTKYFLKDVWGTKTVQKKIVKNFEVVGYVEEEVECIVRQDPLCVHCNSYIKHTHVHTREGFLKVEEDLIFEANVYWPITGILFLSVGVPLGMIVWNWASGLGAFVGTAFVSCGLPLILGRIILETLSLKYKRIVALSVSTIKSALKFGFFGLLAGTILNAILSGLHVPKMAEPFVMLAVLGAFIYKGVKKDIGDLKAVFEIFDDELYRKVEDAYEEMKNDNGAFREDVDYNLKACYAVFDLDMNASLEEVSEKYKKLMMKFHPDKLEHIKNKFPEDYKRSQDISRKLNAAYEYIKEHFSKQAI